MFGTPSPAEIDALVADIEKSRGARREECAGYAVAYGEAMDRVRAVSVGGCIPHDGRWWELKDPSDVGVETMAYARVAAAMRGEDRDRCVYFLSKAPKPPPPPPIEPEICYGCGERRWLNAKRLCLACDGHGIRKDLAR